MYSRVIPGFENLNEKILEQCENLRSKYAYDHQVFETETDKVRLNAALSQLHWVLSEITEEKKYENEIWPSQKKN